MAFGDTIVATVLGQPSVPDDTDATANAVAEGASDTAQPSDASGPAASGLSFKPSLEG
jgi:hypothetical protein